jgi:hypothetical protein
MEAVHFYVLFELINSFVSVVGALEEKMLTSEMLEQFDLSESALRENLLTEHICDFLYCHPFSSLVVRCSAAKCPELAH